MSSHGLTTEAARRYVAAHGFNEIEEKKPSLGSRVVRQLISPISFMLSVAALLSFFGGHGFDGGFILFLLGLNIAITVWQEHKADTAIARLNEHLAVLVRTCRDGAWENVPSRELAQDDLISLKAGAVVPADARVVSGEGTANEAALTGESLPRAKAPGDTLYAGAYVASGVLTALVTATGSRTFFGKTLAKIDTRGRKSTLERDILRISRFLSLLSFGAICLLSAILLVHDAPSLEVLQLDLSLVIAGIPISLPAVMSLIIAFGVVTLSRKEVVVRRLSSLEEVAKADLLLTDKTGTLTENRISVAETRAYEGTPEGLRREAVCLAARDPDEPLNQALLEGMPEVSVDESEGFTPGDSTRKRSTLVRKGKGVLTLGAPQVVMELCRLSDEERSRAESDIARFAEKGYRALALARGEGEREDQLTLLGLFALSDTVRKDAKETVAFLAAHGIQVAMVTGDHREIAREVGKRLGLPGSRVWTRDELLAHGIDRLTRRDFEETLAFAEILPEDKYALVKAADRAYTVAFNGDGVNDLPAVKEASVGFAVKNAVDVLKGAADIVLLSDGIRVMSAAFTEGRRIFERLSVYSLYRISESFRLIVTIAILGVAIGSYPLSPLQLILIALLNDLPIISLAFNRVRLAKRGVSFSVREEFRLGLFFGFAGVVNSLLLFFVTHSLFGLPRPVVETLFFLKLTVSGHLLIYVAHTKERWWRYLPSLPVLLATAGTQAVATLLAWSGLFMPASVSLGWIIFVWVWSLLFMQLSEGMKWLSARFFTSRV
jgi:H+-transporting ATPase